MHFPGGAVYTKPWVVEFMLDEAGYTADHDLTTVKVLEPSCGCGAFLIPIIRRICVSAHNHNRPVESLRNCIIGVEIDEKSAEICRWNVIETLVSEGIPVPDAESLASSWIISEDFLLHRYKGFDLVIGNPPYIRSEDLPSETRRIYANRLETVTMGTDLFVGFIENGLRSLSPTGKLCFICADRWMQNKYGRRLRQFITNEYGIEIICRMHGVDAFESEVSAYPAITLISRVRSVKSKYVTCSEDFGSSDVINLKNALEYGSFKGDKFSVTEITVNGSAPWPLSDAHTLGVVENFTANFPTIEESGVKIGLGVATGRDGIFITTQKDLVESERMLPLIKKEDIVDGSMPPCAIHWLVNPWDDNGELIDLAQYPKTRNYLESHSKSLRERHIAKKNAAAWYRTIDKVNPTLLSKPKLLIQDMSKYPDPYFDEGNYYPSHNMYWITSDKWDLKVLGGVLMSEQIKSFIDAIGVKMRGNTMRCQAQYLRMLHIPYPEDFNETDMSGFRMAFETRDRNMATSCMERLINRRNATNEKQHETGTAEVL